jgi:O-antigen ligase
MKNPVAPKCYALAFGLFLGLCLWKFGNPVILDRQIPPPATLAEWWEYAWPPRWAGNFLLGLALAGAWLGFREKISHPMPKWLWILPLAWLGWQFISAAQTVDAGLTTATLWQLSGCVACYFIGLRLFHERGRQFLLFIGLLVAFTFCLMRAVDQRLFEFPASHQMLLEGERCGWTNYPPEIVVGMKNENVIITTNGVDVANPALLVRFAKGRVPGTLVYPNALAGVILLLFPAALFLVISRTKPLKPAIRAAAIGLAIFLGGASLFWSGSKLGWLIALGVAGLYLWRLNWPAKLKLAAAAGVLVIGLGGFAVRFHHYFATGAHSASARLDYWQAAVQTTLNHPLTGTGPGTFQQAYAAVKAPESEMTRLTHNDYLEQFSDSGLPGGLIYAAWIGLALAVAGRKVWRAGDGFAFAVFAGLLGWFGHGLGEFGLYIPALAWTAFTLLGLMVALRPEMASSSCSSSSSKTPHQRG